MKTIHSLEDILIYGAASYYGYYDGKIHYNIKVYGPADAASNRARHPYDIPTMYIVPITEKHVNLDPVESAIAFKADIINALASKTLEVLPGGTQASQSTRATTFT